MKQINLEDPKTKEVLKLLGLGIVVAASLVLPGLPQGIRPIINYYKKKEREDQYRYWNRFNKYRLKQLLKRLYEQKIIEVLEEDGIPAVKLTEKGRVRVLKYDLEEMFLEKPPRWDGKWRIIIYDISKQKRQLSELFRKFLRKLEFLKLQRSVYITPYPCKEQIEFLRGYHGLSKEILYIEASDLENSQVYKNYFGLK